MRLLILFVISLLVGCQTALPPLPDWQSPQGREHAELGAIVDLRSGERLSPAQLLERLTDTPRLLVGEQHDNTTPCNSGCCRRWRRNGSRAACCWKCSLRTSRAELMPCALSWRPVSRSRICRRR